MTKAQKFKQLLTRPGSVLLPVVHDCLIAKQAQSIGFEAVSVGGFAVSGVHHGLPDVGLIALNEMVSAVTHIVSCVDIPVFADADGGYGNARNVAHCVRQYAAAGVASLFIEDQKHPKRCGHMDGKELIPTAEMVDKIQAAIKARPDPNLTICARTDAIAVEGFGAAIARARAYVKAGADIIFIEAPQNLKQLQAIPCLITQVPLLVNMLEGGKTPLLSQAKLENLGYKLIAHPVTTLFSALQASQRALLHLHQTGRTDPADMLTFQEYKQLVELDKYI